MNTRLSDSLQLPGTDDDNDDDENFVYCIVFNGLFYNVARSSDHSVRELTLSGVKLNECFALIL